MILNAAMWFVAAGLVLLCLLPKRRKNYPPGPFRLPIFGNILSTMDRVHLALARYYKIYGPIFSIKLMHEEIVVLHGAKVIKEAFKLPAFCGRPENDSIKLFVTGGYHGILWGRGPNQTEQRRFAIRHFRNFGAEKSYIQSLIMDEVTEMIDWIKAKNGKPVSLHRQFSLASVNVSWRLLSGNRYHHHDPRLVSILDQLEATAAALLERGVKNVIAYFYPKIAKMFPNWSGWSFLVESLEPRTKLFKDTIAQHERTFQEGHPRDFIDVYLQEIKNTQDEDSTFHRKTGLKCLEAVMADFFVAGSDTTSTILNWAILYLMHYQDVQNKILEEIHRVVGKSRFPSFEDRISMPYTEAFIMELLRITSIVSFGAPHAVTEDVEFHGFFIPKGTTVYASIYGTHHDPDVWVDPENFRPERFLSTDGSKVEKHESMIAFSTGRRGCIGEVLAKDTVFLFLSAFVHQFEISFEPGMTKPTLEPKYGQFTLEARHFSGILKER